MFIGDGCHVFREKPLNGNAENEVSMTWYTPLPSMMKLAAAQFHCNFCLFHELESFCRRFKMLSTLVFMQKLLVY
jgi:hypothetical protein